MNTSNVRRFLPTHRSKDVSQARNLTKGGLSQTFSSTSFGSRALFVLLWPALWRCQIGWIPWPRKHSQHHIFTRSRIGSTSFRFGDYDIVWASKGTSQMTLLAVVVELISGILKLYRVKVVAGIELSTIANSHLYIDHASN